MRYGNFYKEYRVLKCRAYHLCKKRLECSSHKDLLSSYYTEEITTFGLKTIYVKFEFNIKNTSVGFSIPSNILYIDKEKITEEHLNEIRIHVKTSQAIGLSS